MNPKLVFDKFIDHLDYFRAKDDAKVECQHFDRKEACRLSSNGSQFRQDLSKLREHVTETVSAFANTNVDGGLLVLGISKTGEVRGITHLNDDDCNSLSNIDNLLKGHLAQVRLVDCNDDEGKPTKLLLIFAPYTSNALCETPGSRPKAWRRAGRQNVLMSDDQKEQVRREKRIVDFERRLACPYRADLLDHGLMAVARQAWSIPTDAKVTDEELLFQKGAVERDGGQSFFTNAGLLFFGSNPQRVLTTAYVRLLRFDSVRGDNQSPRKPTLDKVFGGAIAKQIQDVRTYIAESALLRTFIRRAANGSFVEEPEYPKTALDEAIVNAIVHRDYGANWAIECVCYQDAFEIKNPGRMLQRNVGVPEQFRLSEISLDHYARNSKLFDWLKDIRDFRGSPFVLGVAEGTRSMSVSTADLRLPSPEYFVKEAETILVLRNDAKRRLAEMEGPKVGTPTRHANLFAFTDAPTGGGALRLRRDARREFLSILRDRLHGCGWFVDSLKFGRLTAHLQGAHYPAPAEVLRIVRLFPAYVISIWEARDAEYICIDYTLEVKNVLSARALLFRFKNEELVGRTAVVHWQGWQRCRIEQVDQEWATVKLLDFGTVERVQSQALIPDLPTSMIKRLLAAETVAFDLDRWVKINSLAGEPNASRKRRDKTQAIAESLARDVFPLTFEGRKVFLSTTPLALAELPAPGAIPLGTIDEPAVEFGDNRETPDIRDGITRFGAFEDTPREIEIIPVVMDGQRRQMEQLIERLKVGKFKYRGAERTFASRLTYRGVVTATAPDRLLAECQRLVSDHPEWVKGDELDKVFLVQAPEQGFSLDDEQSPYFLLKRSLLEAGFPCQMVDTPTLANPDWKDLNLALNLTAKCGLTPWVLPHAIPDADFFVGLSYTENRARGDEKLMGYANVFNQFGRWQFFSGNMTAFPYAEKQKRFGVLVQDTLSRLDLPEMPNIYFHYTAQFSREDRQAILEAARSVRPNGVYTFIWINTHHHVRFYDMSPGGDGSVARGSYISAGAHRVYVSTTGYNPYRKLLGSPVVLEVNVHREYPQQITPSLPDHRAVAAQILALTKLNWASTDSLCGEPITTKYAGDIARLTAAFMRQTETFRLHPRLEQTPWFI